MTGQIKRLLFPGNSDAQAARNRLRLLYDHGFLGRLQPYVRLGESTATETAYYIEKKARALLGEAGEVIPPYATGANVKHLFIEHALDLSEFRLHLEVALQEQPVMYSLRYLKAAGRSE